MMLFSQSAFSQVSYYHHGFDGLLLWENRERPEKDLIISSFGAKISIKEDVGYLLYFAYTAGKIDVTTNEYVISTSDFKVSGFIDITYTENAILVDYTYERVQWPDGRAEIYKPLD
jgi:hypothetical protein